MGHVRSNEWVPEEEKGGRIGILGGTFDPVHIGHLACAEAVGAALGLSRVVLMPAGEPSFKRGATGASAEDRLSMVDLAVADNPRLAYSGLEVARAGVTYTADTLRELRRRLPIGCEVVFILGADSFLTLDRWHDHADLGGLATFAVAGRPGFTVGKADLDRVRRACDIDPVLVTVPALDVASRTIRERMAAGEPVRYLIPDAVEQFIGRRGLYGAAEGKEGTVGSRKRAFKAEENDDPFFAARREELQGRVGPRRFRHSLGVSDTAGELAHIYGADEAEARLAGLLHDWDKGLDDPGILARADELGMELSDELRSMPRVLHGLTAARALARDFPELSPELLQAVERHTLGAVDMSPMDMIVYIADALEPGREGKRVEKLRALIGKASLRELFVAVYAYWVELMMERKSHIYSKTVDIWNAYMPPARPFIAAGADDPMPYGRA
ncbi:nicotinate-nucleotide adenylyltransferase [Eggerthellaceae bacterium 24-137]